jgi:hypothetical protein
VRAPGSNHTPVTRWASRNSRLSAGRRCTGLEHSFTGNNLKKIIRRPAAWGCRGSHARGSRGDRGMIPLAEPMNARRIGMFRFMVRLPHDSPSRLAFRDLTAALLQFIRFALEFLKQLAELLGNRLRHQVLKHRLELAPDLLADLRAHSLTSPVSLLRPCPWLVRGGLLRGCSRWICARRCGRGGSRRGRWRGVLGRDCPGFGGPVGGALLNHRRSLRFGEARLHSIGFGCAGYPAPILAPMSWPRALHPV